MWIRLFLLIRPNVVFRMKWSLLVIACIIVCSSCVNVFKMVDIRTDEAKEAKGKSKALYLLKRMQDAHGVKHWKNIESYTVDFEDTFFGVVGRTAHPYKEQSVSFRLNYIPGTYDGRMIFTSGKQSGDEWGIQSWNTYEKNSEGELIFEKNKQAEFWLPTYQYFIELPARISSANVFVYAGQRKIEGVLCEGILASWNTSQPQKGIDQYLIWLDKITKRIVKVEYTVRDAYKFVSGAAIYKDYKDFNGLLLPTRMPVESNLVNKGYLHEMKIKSFQTNVVELDYIRPNADIPVVGDSKN